MLKRNICHIELIETTIITRQIFNVKFDYEHCVKSVQIRRFSWSVFYRIQTEYGHLLYKCPYSVRIQENTDQKKHCIWTLFTQRKFQIFQTK